MKSTMQYASLILAFIISSGCQPSDGSDTRERVESQNEQNFEKTEKNADADFAMHAAWGGLLEVKLGDMAATKASSVDVRNFGTQMVHDHTAGNKELEELALSKGIALPTTVDDDKMNDVNSLTDKIDKDFDLAYIRYMIKDHKEDIDLFEKEVAEGNDAQLKSWAEGKLPMLKHHLNMAEEIEHRLSTK